MINTILLVVRTIIGNLIVRVWVSARTMYTLYITQNMS